MPEDIIAERRECESCSTAGLVAGGRGSGLSVSCRGSDSAHFSLPDSTGSVNGVDMLKVHCSHPQLIVQLKFCKRETCRRFLRSYREGALQQSLQNHLQLSLAMSTVPLEMELKTGSEHLDSMLEDEDRCLDCIYREKVRGCRREEWWAGLGEAGVGLALLQHAGLLTSPSFGSPV